MTRDWTPRQDSLVVYKGRPARVRHAGKSLEIELPGGESANVRPKDVVVLHPGPLQDLRALGAVQGDVDTAWELLAGGQTELPELAELAFGEYTPATAWAAWQLVADGLYFRGTAQEVEARTAEEVARERNTREARAAEEKAWAGFLERLRKGRVHREDRAYLREVEEVALGRREKSRVLRALGRGETPENAHALLLELGTWDATVDPYPQRLGLATEPVALPWPELPEEARQDLTHLAAFAIDDEATDEPDDALSLEGGRLWVHVADVAAAVPPDSPADLEARARGATLYLPESPVRMLPHEAIRTLALGLGERSPALSFALDLDGEGRVQNLEIVPSWVRVERLTYDQAEARLTEEPFHALYALAEAQKARRQASGALEIALPEVKILAAEGQVSIRPLPPLRSRDLVTEAMVLAGAAVARFAVEHGIPLPFTTQESPSTDERPSDLAGMYALRQNMRPSQYSTAPGQHAGLGLDVYAQATSPLRRYLDLVVHQQLRGVVLGRPLLDSSQVLERVGATLAVMGSVRQAERLARRHWTLVYLLQHPEWVGTAVVVEKREQRLTALIPELDLDVQVYLKTKLSLNDPVRLAKPAVNLPELAVRFQVV